MTRLGNPRSVPRKRTEGATWDNIEATKELTAGPEAVWSTVADPQWDAVLGVHLNARIADRLPR